LIPHQITGLTVFQLPHHAWLISGGVFLFVLVLVWFHYSRILARIKKEEQQKRLMLQESLRLQILELQAQVRPHFIFNAINSIQSYILNQDVDRAIHYLSLFSKLIRRTMENADRELIPVSEELEIVRHFLEIEKMRFEGLLDYKIELPEEQSLSTCQIPPMILQPFIDMAIRKGIRQRDDNGLLTVSVETSSEKILRIRIRDNGPGWEQSLLEKSRHEDSNSLNYRILCDRIKLLNEVNKTRVFDVDVKDLRGSREDILGTEVVLSYQVKEG